ncbi:MAG: HEAT repeat domain-containing protein, partial [Planctomycetes bacterium]|nr:HEAT repeat domain-containing protein [Planctomycetota bacterium]
MMNKSSKTLLFFALAYVFITSASFSQSFTPDEIKDVIKAFGKYNYAGDPTPTHTIDNIIRYVGDKPQLRALTEQQMIALLESDATFRAKQFVCHQLWIIGTDRSVPTLEKMLLNKDTAEIACYALRTHPSQAASRALREAIDRVDDATKVQIVNIIGDRKDVAGIDQLTGLLKSDNAAIAEAAAISLGTIGTDKAVRAIAEARAAASGKMRAILTRAWLRGAEYYARNNRMAEALAIYETLFDESQPLLARRSALVGGLVTGDRRAVGLMNAAIDQDIAVLRAAAIANSAMLKGQKVTKKLIATLKTAAPQTQVLIVEALAQRDDPLVKDAVTAAAYSKNADVRIAAFNALGDAGDGAAAALLCSALAKAQTQPEADTISASLRRMKGGGVDRAIVDSLSDANPAVRTQLIG